MNNRVIQRSTVYLIAGDILIVFVIAVIGFISHGTLGDSGSGGRLLATLIPYWVAWLMTAIPLSALDPELTQNRGLWRPIWAVVLTAPLGAWLRGLWLGTPVLTSFVWVMLAFVLLGILLWRLFFNYVIFPRTGM